MAPLRPLFVNVSKLYGQLNVAAAFSPSFAFERTGRDPVIGIDEVGCGAWAGPVIAAAVYIHPKCPLNLLSPLKDSKQLSSLQRENIFTQILAHPDFFTIGIGEGTLEDILTHNIRGATLLAMRQAFEALQARLIRPVVCALVDGRSKPSLPCETLCIIKGDQQSYSIAAASVVAKVTRDRLMVALGAQYPLYGWEKNVGYGTPSHQKSLRQWGPTVHHRVTFKPIAALLEPVE